MEEYLREQIFKLEVERNKCYEDMQDKIELRKSNDISKILYDIREYTGAIIAMNCCLNELNRLNKEAK